MINGILLPFDPTGAFTSDICLPFYFFLFVSQSPTDTSTSPPTSTPQASYQGSMGNCAGQGRQQLIIIRLGRLSVSPANGLFHEIVQHIYVNINLCVGCPRMQNFYHRSIVSLLSCLAMVLQWFSRNGFVFNPLIFQPCEAIVLHAFTGNTDPKYKILVVAIDAASTVNRKVFFIAVLVLPPELRVFFVSTNSRALRNRGNEQK